MAPESQLCFGPYELDTGTGELTRRGRPVDLQPQPARVLVELVRRAGELVPREELEDLLWEPDTHVDRQQGLNYCIRCIRRALGDSGRSARYVETVPRRGYRFVAPTERVPRQTPHPDAGRGGRSPAGRRRRRWIAAALTLAVVAAAALVALALSVREPAGGGSHGGAPAEQRELLAVLPLHDLSRGGDPYFAAGLSDELTSSLGRLDPERLGVIARTSAQRFADSSAGVQEIGRALGADLLLEGSVRRDGDRVRIAVRLIGVEDQALIWSGTYEERVVDVFALQRKVAREVAGALSLELPALTDAGEAPDPEAFEAYLQGLHLLDHPVAGRDAEEYLRRAVELDPDLARAWGALAQHHYNERPFDVANVERARRAARRSLEIAPSSTAHLGLGMIAFYNDLDFDEAERQLTRAIEVNPSDASAQHHYASLLMVQGRSREALETVRRALRLDPLTLNVEADLGWFNLFAREYRMAEAHFRATLEVASGRGSYWARRGLLGTLVRSRRWQAAADLVTTWPADDTPGVAVEPVPGDPRATVERFLRRELAQMQRLHEEGLVAPASLAVNHALLADADAAMDWLERSLQAGWGWQIPFLRLDPRFDVLRGQPRFERLTDRLGLPRPETGEPAANGVASWTDAPVSRRPAPVSG